MQNKGGKLQNAILQGALVSDRAKMFNLFNEQNIPKKKDRNHTIIC